MKKRIDVRRITLNAILVALMCALGMFSIQFGENIKVSLQFLVVLVSFALLDHLMDKIIVTTSYLIIGLLLPVYAGFNTGVSPTFGFVIGFIFASFAFHFMNKLPLKNEFLKFFLTSIASLLVVYVFGSVFLAVYLQLDFVKSLMISVVPYIVFDLVKIEVAYLITFKLKKIIYREN